MSIIVATGEAISKSLLNHSPSKQMYSFGKAARFAKRHQLECSDNLYNLPEVRSKRATTLGKGNKHDFTACQKGNNAQFISAKSDFDKQHPYAPQYTFGLGRDKFEKVYLDSSKAVDKDIPGPGKYNILRPFGYESSKYTIQGRLNTHSIDRSKIPGPGAYNDCLQINVNGKFPLSTISNLHKVNFGIDKSKRFVYDLNKTPGPSDYAQKPLMGFIFNSRYRSSSSKSILSKPKDVDSRLNYPGPGQYRAFSEFGIYESKHSANPS